LAQNGFYSAPKTIFFSTFGAKYRIMLVGRSKEIAQFAQIMQRPNPDFVAVYGRRRVGKTFLIKEFFKHQFTFYFTGLSNSKTTVQLNRFTEALNETFGQMHQPATDWLNAFDLLRKCLMQKASQEQIVIFIDELPWLDTKKSDFITGLEYFWNSWASTQLGLKLIGCGSAASWMLNELIKNKGGLYNRVTQRIKVEPFQLHDTAALLTAKGIVLDPYQIVQIYLVTGGIPHYLDQLQRGLSAAQNIQRLCFDETGLLRSEFQFVFSSLFGSKGKHEDILRAIYALGARATREKITDALKKGTSGGGDLSKKLQELEESGFLKSYRTFGVPNSKRVYFICDYYTLFYLRFLEGTETSDQQYWLNKLDDADVRAWQGFAFERLCWDHIAQIKQKLGISGVATEISTWSTPGSMQKQGAQIDLVLDRKDRVVNLIEVKFAGQEYEINKQYDAQLRTKVETFRQETKTRKAVLLVMLTTFGVKEGMYKWSVPQAELKLDDLFAAL
jgi:uncharacterized protein